jgi:hypothetical protein
VARLELRGSRNAEVADRQSGGTARRRGCELGCTIADERSGCARGRFWPNLFVSAPKSVSGATCGSST